MVVPSFHRIVFVTDFSVYTDGDVDMLGQGSSLIYDEDRLVDPQPNAQSQSPMRTAISAATTIGWCFMQAPVEAMLTLRLSGNGRRGPAP
jgi:hypothetical protein